MARLPTCARPLASAAHNSFIREAAPGAWVVPLDDGDIMLQRTLHYYAAHIQAHPGRP